MTENRAFRKTRIGQVVSDKMDKTIVVLRNALVFSVIYVSSSDVGLLTNNGLDAGDVLLDCRDLHGVLQLIGSVLHSQHEQVLLQVVQLLVQLFNRLISNFLCLHHYSPPFSVSASLAMIRVLMGSLC